MKLILFKDDEKGETENKREIGNNNQEKHSVELTTFNNNKNNILHFYKKQTLACRPREFGMIS